MSGLVPEQLAQKMYAYARSSFPVVPAVNVWPMSEVLLKPYPEPNPLSSAC